MASLLLALSFLVFSDEQQVRARLEKTTGVVELPAGVVEISAELVLPPGAHDLQIRGAKEGTILRASARFQGSAVLVAIHIQGLQISHVTIEQAPGDAILIGEGTTNFEVSGCELRKLGGSGIVVHGAQGKITNNTVTGAARAAFLIGDASEIRVENNTAEGIGFGLETKKDEIPAAIATTGETVKSVFAGNHFSEINGNCISLAGFHDGEVRGNSCDNREPPEAYPNGGYGIFTSPSKLAQRVLVNGNTFDGMKFGGMFIAGSGYILTRNRLYHVNTSHCPLTAGGFACVPSDGIYLAGTGNLVEDNLINGFRMSEHCIGNAPGITPEKNRVARNDCSDDGAVNARNGVNEFPVRHIFPTFDGEKLAIAPRRVEPAR